MVPSGRTICQSAPPGRIFPLNTGPVTSPPRISMIRRCPRAVWPRSWIGPTLALMAKAKRVRGAVAMKVPMSVMISSTSEWGGSLSLFAQQMIRNDPLLDLAGALEYLGEPRVAPVAFDGVQGRVAGAAEDLQ